MFDALLARIQQKKRTIKFPAENIKLPARFRGLPAIDTSKCEADCGKCIDACPTGAIDKQNDMILDMGKCLFCANCAQACEKKVISFTNDYKLSVNTREDLKLSGQALKLAGKINDKSRSIFGRSLKLRQVSAAGCNACEADINVLSTVVFDLGRFGVQFVASPRHADGLVITGPVSKNMELALKKTYDAIPEPKIVIVVGACAISGGLFAGHNETLNGAESLLKVDLFIPGCPPHPLTILDGILRFLGKI